MYFFVFVLFLIWMFVIANKELKSDTEQRTIERKAHQENMKKNGFNADVEYSYEDISHKLSVRYLVDNTKKMVLITENNISTEIPFSEIIGCEILTDSEVSGGVGRAVVGGVLAGGAGAVVGATTAKKHIMSYSIVIYRENIYVPKKECVLIKRKTSTKDYNYLNAVKFASDINASIRAIVSVNQMA